jgi:uncharacterized protein (TIGR02246 family)
MLQRYFDAWNEGDAEAIAQCFHADARFHDPSLEEPLAGRSAIRAHVQKVLRYWPEEEWAALRHWEHRRGATLVWRATITSPWTGRDVTFEGVNIMELEDGLISELQVFFDPARWRGLVPKPFVPPDSPEYA